MLNTVRFFATLATLLLFGVPLMAQNDVRLELFGGVNFPKEKDFEISAPQSSVPLKGTHEFSAGGRGGLRIGVDGKGHWGQDIDYSYGANATKIVNHTTGGQFAFTSRTHQISLNGLWYPGGVGPKKKALPYLTVGVGATFYTLTQTIVNEALDPNRAGLGKLRNENIFAFNAGGGIRFKVNDLYGFRIDVKDYMTRAVRYQLPKSSSDPSATVFPIGGIFHQYMISFSFVYYYK
jgi:opacity protein-like surface antigen